MLKYMRTGAQSIVLKVMLFGLLLMAMLGLAVLDVQGMFRGGIGKTTVASIGRDKITTVEAERIVGSALNQQNIPPAVAAQIGLPQQIITQEIGTRLFSRAARDAGLIPDDKAVAKELNGVIAPLVEQGLSKKDALNRILTNAGMSEANLVNSIRAQMAGQALTGLIASGAHAPKQMLEDAMRFKREQRKAEHFTLTAADLGKKGGPSDAELKDYYKTVSGRFSTPEYRAIDVLVLDKKTLGAEHKVTDEDLKAYYDEHKEDYAGHEARTVEQVVAKDEATAKAVYEAASKAGDLQKAAGASTFIKGQSYAEKDLAGELAPAAFKAKEGEVLAPVKSPLGWHVMRVTKISAASAKTFDSVKADIAKDLSADKNAEALYEQANKIDDMLAGGKGIDEVAKQFALKPVSYGKVAASGYDAAKNAAMDKNAFPAFDKVLENAFRLQKDETSQLIETPSGDYVIVGVRDIFAPAEQPLEKVRGAVLESWNQKETADLVDKAVAKINERLKMGETFEKVAASYGKKPAATDTVTRETDADKSGLGRSFVPALFSVPNVGDATAIASGDTVAVLRLTARTIPPAHEENKEETAALEAQIARALQGDILDQYRTVLFGEYDVSINDKVIQDLFRPREDENSAETE